MLKSVHLWVTQKIKQFKWIWSIKIETIWDRGQLFHVKKMLSVKNSNTSLNQETLEAVPWPLLVIEESLFYWLANVR